MRAKSHENGNLRASAVPFSPLPPLFFPFSFFPPPPPFCLMQENGIRDGEKFLQKKGVLSPPPPSYLFLFSLPPSSFPFISLVPEPYRSGGLINRRSLLFFFLSSYLLPTVVHSRRVTTVNKIENSASVPSPLPSLFPSPPFRFPSFDEGLPIARSSP